MERDTKTKQRTREYTCAMVHAWSTEDNLKELVRGNTVWVTMPSEPSQGPCLPVFNSMQTLNSSSQLGEMNEGHILN